MLIRKFSLNALRWGAVMSLALAIVSCGTTSEKPVLPAPPPPKPSVVKPLPTKPVIKQEMPQTTKVGFVVPLSGSHAELGRALQQSAQVALFDMKKDGVELVFADSQGTAEGAHKAAQEVIRKGAQMIIGPVFAEEVQAVKALVSARKIPLLAFTTDKSMADDNVFVLGFSPQEQIERVLKYAAFQGLIRVALLIPSNPYGKLVEEATNHLEQQGLITIVARESYASQDIGTPALTSKIEKIQAATPQALLVPEGGKSLMGLLPYLESYALTSQSVQLLGSGQWDSSDVWKIQGLQGAWFASPAPQLRQEFEEHYKSAFISQSPRIAPLAYDAVALAAVLSTRGNFSPQALEVKQGFSGIDGIFRFKDHIAERGLSILEVREAQVVVRENAPDRF
ncbi:Penicillin-binding protein activator [Candidatus Bealeia paramacronuclearis]|uniref:Penicillin-binding protein activator n=1 Tax=Candidatus Bealeia paramacronuclearis TaxID=1921001 RepID=A0ABZ2C4A2_9PROT|nr:Penicillin-binding protein activator [Candidatus Bealeia paramacronuclearis]